MKLASIETIKEIVPHGGADKLEIAKILGWQSIVKKGEFKAGDKVVFVVIDTILPNAHWSEFLADKSNPEKPIRLRTVKLRGEYSQGLVLPLTVLPENVQGWHEGADVGGALGIKRYEKEIPAQLSGEVVGPFPTYLASKTDEDNGLSNPDLVDEVLKHPVTICGKMDGSSCSIFVKNGIIEQVCSRKLSLKETDTNAFWKVARELTIPQNWSGTIQGEVCGVGINGNRHNLSKPTLYVFQVRPLNQDYLTYNEMQSFCAEELNCLIVPLVGYYESITLDEVCKIADSQVTEDGKPSEGVVVRPSDYRQSGVGRPLGFKIINRNYED